MCGQPGVWACLVPAGVWAVLAGGLGLGSGLCTQPPPHPHVPALQACPSCRPSPGSVLQTACACCLCKPSSFAQQSKEPLLFGNEASSLTDSPSRVPSCQPSWTYSSCLCALSASCPSPAHGALWVPPAGVPCVHTDLPLAQCWSEQALWFSALFPGARRSRLERLTAWREGQRTTGDTPGLRRQLETSRRLSWFQSLTEALKRPFLCSVYHLSLWVRV